jgi:hypothetical protein
VEDGEHQGSDVDSGEDDEMDLDSDLGLQVSGPAVALTVNVRSARHWFNSQTGAFVARLLHICQTQLLFCTSAGI